MSLQVEKLEHNMAKLTIEASAEDLEKALQAAYLKNKKKISIPGFRKGKVPRQMVEKMYGPEIFYEDAANELIPEAYEKEVEASDLEVVSRPDVDVVQIEKGKPFIFTAEVALKPAVELGKYKGVKVEKANLEVSEEEILKEIDKERERNARTISVEDRPVKDGDMTVIDFEGFVDDVAFEGGKGENYPLTIGSNTFIPGFEDQLIGAELNQEVTVNVTFPEEYQAKELAGKPAKFICTVKEIKEKELPELDDEFAGEVSEFETLAEYKEDIKKKLVERKTSEAKREKEDKVVEAIVEDSNMDVPEAMIEAEAYQMIQNYAGRLAQQGLSLDQYFQFTGLNAEKMLEQMKPQAEKGIKARLVLEAVADAEKIEASEEAFEEELKTMSEVYQMEVEKMKDLLDEREEKQIRKDIVIKKAIEFVVENAKESKAK
ncbi:trigger factor [bacterium C-53]|nr:trigger factor [Lachnospiraceae bacterium]NBI02362.1 trigger factor [Lachnospiraceae bacterium]RKJ11915.1 trigger factor [bacterium C-53]